MSGAAPTPEEALEVLDRNAVRRWAVLVRSAFAARRAEIDALNVFPVPDGDTGTNLYLTFDGGIERTLAADASDDSRAAGGSAHGAVRPAASEGAGPLLRVFAENLLWTARGNSGVILSQLARGLAEAVGDASVVDAASLAAGLQRADLRAWEGVTDPVEGTILSVSKAAAAVAEAAVPEGLHAVAARALDAAQEALAHTPEQLPILARAGVVDAGGAGYVIVLECLERLAAGDDGRVVLGLTGMDRRERFRPGHEGVSVTRPLDDDIAGPEVPRGPEYEVMYLLSSASDEAAARLRSRLRELGDSVLVVGNGGEWNVHAHVDDAGAAVEAGVEAGRPHRVRITRLLTDEGLLIGVHGDRPAHARTSEGGPQAVAPLAGTRTGIVACVAGDGIAQLFTEAGAVVIPSGPGRRASTGQLIDAIREQHALGAGGVVVLPNDNDTGLAAAAAARAVADEGIEALVVRARTAVQGIAALAVFSPDAAPAANLLGMQSAASATRHGAVTVANRVGLTSGGRCEPGDVLGVVDGDIVIVGDDQLIVAREVVHRLLASGGELVTVVLGEAAPGGIADAIAAEARGEHRGIEVVTVEGGQSVYSVLVGVE